ncbi:DoxX family protein [Actinomadura rupiterrae]|uniref:DoxX family protein n=1 Tax=Actinomadura rupiterrae TaxID=559627 RepID=UPI0020A456E7|nr:hypothetical protein [Actinomadura rupiterrae]MCP2343222.1 putative membrane protein [Actinomadura rupiterrae]
MQNLIADALGAFLIVVGVAHFVLPGYFRSLVPSWLGAAGAIVALSGVAEIGVGGLVLVRPVAGGWTAAVLITGYLVSHFDALRHASRERGRLLDRPAGVAARLVVNGLYIAWAVVVATVH